MFQNMSIPAILLGGGPVFILLIGFSVFSIAVMIERYTAFQSLQKKTRLFQSLLLEKLKTNKVSEALDLCKLNGSPVADIFIAAIERKGKSREVIEEAIQRKGIKLGLYLEKRLIILATTGSITPFVGLFGTVLGIINAFKSISLAESFSPSLVANGIAEALLNTAAGLFVAIPAVIAYNVFTRSAQNFLKEMEAVSSEVVELLTERTTW